MPTRRDFLVRATAAALAVPLGASACTAGTGAGAAGTGGGKAVDTLVFGKTDAGTTFVRNYNMFTPATQKTPHGELIYESLLRVDYSDGAKVKPWLAESAEFDEAGTTLTVQLRDDVTFSDGKPLTADDVVFSLGVPLKDPSFNTGGITYEKVEKQDERTVTVRWPRPAFSESSQLASIQVPIVPKHIWEGKDLKSWTNPDPVGTGPFTLERFAAQQLTLKAREDYWGGAFELKTLKIVPTSPDTVKAQLLRGEVDWTLQAWNGAEKEYVAKDPKHHLYEKYATGGAYSLFFNTARAPFDDVHVRRALALTIPRKDIVTTLQRPGTEAGPTGLVDEIFADVILPEYRGKVQQVDVAAALRELEQSGYEIKGGKLVKDGKSYTPKISFNQDFGWDAYANLMIRSWQKHLGLTVKSTGAPGANLFEQQQTGDFDLTISTTGGAGVAGLYSALSSRAYRPLGEKAATNFGRWKDGRTEAAIARMQGTNDPAVIESAAHELQRIVAEQVPFSPIYNSYWFVAVNAKRWTGWPTPENFTAVPMLGLGPDATRTLQSLKRAAK
ncbi:ABC transporter substrate-binding protein [Streptomyces indicus]|uniref:Peptide/nickel transport system substrate-binding protein n=1 Tax=Streptomyces indicus TaxID=417292 RepID=A0A1G8UYD8_9ACTN|nr:ABC transporter substrate-binding protein [Streptomyces indicus]SDJ58125.1 peptide/nickel transport system substrate-binding protein [Streptomyces indicus]